MSGVLHVRVTMEINILRSEGAARMLPEGVVVPVNSVELHIDEGGKAARMVGTVILGDPDLATSLAEMLGIEVTW